MSNQFDDLRAAETTIEVATVVDDWIGEDNKPNLSYEEMADKFESEGDDHNARFMRAAAKRWYEVDA